MHVDSRAPPIRAENDRITFFAIFDPANLFAAQKRLGRNGHMHVRPSPRIPYIGRPLYDGIRSFDFLGPPRLRLR